MCNPRHSHLFGDDASNLNEHLARWHGSLPAEVALQYASACLKIGSVISLISAPFVNDERLRVWFITRVSADMTPEL